MVVAVLGNGNGCEELDGNRAVLELSDVRNDGGGTEEKETRVVG